MTGDSWPPPPDWWTNGDDPPDTDPLWPDPPDPRQTHRTGPLAGRQPEPEHTPTHTPSRALETAFRKDHAMQITRIVVFPIPTYPVEG